MIRIPVVIERKLVNNQLDRCVRDWTTKVIVSLDLDFDFLAHTKGFLFPVLLRRLHFNLELRQLVFFESKQLCATDLLLKSRFPERNAVFPERQLFTELERSPRA